MLYRQDICAKHRRSIQDSCITGRIITNRAKKSPPGGPIRSQPLNTPFLNDILGLEYLYATRLLLGKAC